VQCNVMVASAGLKVICKHVHYVYFFVFPWSIYSSVARTRLRTSCELVLWPRPEVIVKRCRAPVRGTSSPSFSNGFSALVCVCVCVCLCMCVFVYVSIHLCKCM
jgi:hypothetical protein